jgi:hypothetical protein
VSASWGIAVCSLDTTRRVGCPRCAVTVELVPWAGGKNHPTTAHQRLLARRAKIMSWEEIDGVFRTTRENVFRSVRMAVS